MVSATRSSVTSHGYWEVVGALRVPAKTLALCAIMSIARVEETTMSHGGNAAMATKGGKRRA